MPRRARTSHIVFHTAAAQGDPSRDDIDRWHRQRGWSGIGYHYVIRKDGTVEEGRAEDQVGAHCADGGKNHHSVGVVFSGHHGDDYHNVPGEAWTPEQEAAWLTLARSLMATYDIPVPHVIGHWEAGARKACPGDRVDCDAVRATLAAFVDDGDAPAPIPLEPVVLTDSVGGSGGANRDADVRMVQGALKEAARLTLDARLDPGPVDGICGDGTEGAIVRMQRRIGMWRPDARIDPNGGTLKRLNALRAIGRVDIRYPFAERSSYPFAGPEAGMRAFGSRRSGGARAHAAVDLYMPDGTPVLALAHGTVAREPYAFYRDTWALDIDHGAFLARYCELERPEAGVFAVGDAVTSGQPIGAVGVMKNADGTRWTGVASMMLHLELYDKTETGKLYRAVGTSARSVHYVPFFRRKDLIDPTGFILRASLPA
jgi:murein DD-endopeptidase MepM/ murein hydrolase activator NlpD